jgi:hypothetical protein
MRNLSTFGGELIWRELCGQGSGMAVYDYVVERPPGFKELLQWRKE